MSSGEFPFRDRRHAGQVTNSDPSAQVSPALLAGIVARERAELHRREHLYRGDQPALDVHGRTVIVVDDGLATGSTMRAAVLALRQQQPARICIAVPVGAATTCERLRADADEVVCAAMPADFRAVGLAYEAFPQASDADVQSLLEAARLAHAAATH